MDVGLVPYGMSEFNRWSFPMKALEYLSAGLPVVSTSLPAMQWLDTPFIALADTPEAFAGRSRRLDHRRRRRPNGRHVVRSPRGTVRPDRAERLAKIVQTVGSSSMAVPATG